MYKKTAQEVSVEVPGEFGFPNAFDPNNRWIKIFMMIPWLLIEERYASLFVNNGAPAHPVRIALGSLIIQSKLNCSDEELIQQIKENPYLQYVLGAPEFSSKPLFGASTLVDFRKRFGKDKCKFLSMVNEEIIPKLTWKERGTLRSLVENW